MNRARLKNRVVKVTGRTDMANVLAELLGISLASVSNKSTGRTPLTAEEINRIRLAFGLTDRETIEWLVEC